MTERDLLEIREQIRQKMKDAGTLRLLPKAGRSDRRERAAKEKAWFLRTYCPHYFPYEFSSHHLRVLQRCDLKNIPYILSAFRGFGKSSVASFGDPLWKVLHELRHFLLFVSYTEDVAESFTLPLKVELEENPRIQQDFGALTGSRVWTSTDFILRNDVRCLARGIFQPFRGLRHGPYRPDEAILDDYENDSTAESPEQTEKIGNRIWKTIRPALQRRKDGGFTLKLIGTTITPECNQTRLLEDEDRDLVKDRIAIIDDDGNPTWPDVYDQPEIDGLRTDLGLAAWHSEALLDPLPAGERDFREEWFAYVERVPQMPNSITRGAVDPSATSSGDPKAVVTLTGDRATMLIYCQHAYIKKASPHELCKAIHTQQDLYHTDYAIEDNGLKDYLWEAVENYEKQEGVHLRLYPVSHHLPKAERIRKLQTPMERHQIVFQKGHSDQDELIRQLRAFPSKKAHDDGPDALEEAYQQVMKQFRGLNARRLRPGSLRESAVEDLTYLDMEGFV